MFSTKRVINTVYRGSGGGGGSTFLENFELRVCEMPISCYFQRTLSLIEYEVKYGNFILPVTLSLRNSVTAREGKISNTIEWFIREERHVH